MALDIGTDLLPALALGSEAPSKGALKRPPERRHLMDRALMFRVFGLLGPVEALMEMIAYTAVLFGAGWSPGAELPPSDVLMAASAPHSPPWSWASSPTPSPAAAPPPRLAAGLAHQPAAALGRAGGAGSAGGLPVPRPLAALLGHAPPTPGGLAVALAAIPAVLLADSLYKAAGTAGSPAPPSLARAGQAPPIRRLRGPKPLTPRRAGQQDRTIGGRTPRSAGMPEHVLWFEEIGNGATFPRSAAKNGLLGELIQSLKARGVRVPDGFATTAAAYRTFIAANGIEPAMRSRILAYRSGDATLRETGEAIRELFLASDFPEDIAESIRSHYRDLGRRAGRERLSVAVRSSATAEDLPDASFAGQQETFLNVAGDRELMTPAGAATPRCSPTAPSATGRSRASTTSTSRSRSACSGWSAPTSGPPG